MSAAVAAPPVRRAGVIERLSGVQASALALALGAVLWEVVGRVARVPFFPPLTDVLAELWTMVVTGQIFGNLVESLGNLVIGFGLSLTVGIVLGTAMGRYWRVNAMFGVYVYALLTAPSLVFAPIFFSILGSGRASIVGVIFMYSAFIMIITTASAVENVPPALIEMGRSYGASEWQLLRRVILPAAAPSIFAGIRLGVGRAVTGMINGEMFIAVVGLGRIVTQAGKRFDGAGVLAILLVIIVVAVAAVTLTQIVDRRITSWVPRTSKDAT
jgi:NitT/TauT family transport system permease protein